MLFRSTNMEVVIDLQQTTEISSISVGSLQNAGAYIFFPKKMEFFVSEDGVRFQKVAEVLNDANPLSGEKQLKDFLASFNPAAANFIKVVAQNLGKCPKGHVGEGNPAWMFIDEIAIN